MNADQWLAVALWTVCVLLLVRAVWPTSYRPWNRIRRRAKWTFVDPTTAEEVEVVPEWPALRAAYRFPIPKEPAAADLLRKVKEDR